MTTTSTALLPPLQKLVGLLEDDIRERIAEVPELEAHVAREFAAAKAAHRTGEDQSTFAEQLITQAAVAWVLGAVFVRFLEDNDLLDPRTGGRERWIAGADHELVELARDHQRDFFRAEPAAGEREYLLHVFERIAARPGMARLFDRRRNPIWTLGPSADGARALLERFRRQDPATGAIELTFGAAAAPGEPLDTRFLGDLYQDLSEATRKRYALLQTPEFVEEFLLDRTLTPAIDRWGADAVRLIDPACGSGHFLLGAFARLLSLQRELHPLEKSTVLAQRVLDQVAGVDLNPFAVAIARFRLLIAALSACGIRRLDAKTPDFQPAVAAGDSLLHGRRPGELFEPGSRTKSGVEHHFASEDPELLAELLGRRYHVVVGNPPYITVKDPGLRDFYRERFPKSCHRQYSLVCPFLERVFDLALQPPDGSGPERQGEAGWVAVIVANSFMKREFGTKLVERVLPDWDVSHVIDTSGAYIPGHGTPTVVLIGRARPPAKGTVRAVLGIRGEPETPADPAHGLVWSAIVRQIDRGGSESDWISVEDVPRERLARHPWSVQGGGAAGLKARLDASASQRLEEQIAEIGRTTHTGEDNAFFVPPDLPGRLGLSASEHVPLVTGEDVRDFQISPRTDSLLPYDREGQRVELSAAMHRHFWRFRTSLANRRDFGQTPAERGLRWFDHSMFFANRFRTPLSITFAFVATHNHFVLDRGGKVFNRSAPVIKLPEGASEEQHLGLLGLLNSSTACFWMQQVFHNKGGPGGASSKDEKWHDFYEHDGTKLQQFPLPAGDAPLTLARTLDRLAAALAATSPAGVCGQWSVTGGSWSGEPPTRARLDAARAEHESIRRQMVALQEELDWHCYRLYGLVAEDLTVGNGEGGGGKGEDATAESDSTSRAASLLPPLALGHRAFEVHLARRMAAGEVETRWFERHGSTPITELPEFWPADYRALVERRLAAIAGNPAIRQIEKPEYKRRWASEPWEQQEQGALREWLLDRLEGQSPASSSTSPSDSESNSGPNPQPPTPNPFSPWSERRLLSTAELTDRLRRDPDFLAVARLYTGREDLELSHLVRELVLSEAVPNLPRDRYSAAGLRKRAVWERVWALQREEDALDARAALPTSDPRRLDQAALTAAKAALDIPVPPKYTSADFAKAGYWKLRGKLDVPKERFILYPGASRDTDPSPTIGWAGWTHLDQAHALAERYTTARQDEAWPRDRLLPLLDGLGQLIPWLLQWHNHLDPEHGERMGDFFRRFIEGERRSLG